MVLGLYPNPNQRILDALLAGLDSELDKSEVET